jgi:hypothetical protein
MGRYFFHVTSAQRTYPDEVGQEFASLDDARRHAEVIAAELARADNSYRGFEVCILDSQGAEVTRVPIVRGAISPFLNGRGDGSQSGSKRNWRRGAPRTIHAGRRPSASAEPNYRDDQCQADQEEGNLRG